MTYYLMKNTLENWKPDGVKNKKRLEWLLELGSDLTNIERIGDTIKIRDAANKIFSKAELAEMSGASIFRNGNIIVWRPNALQPKRLAQRRWERDCATDLLAQYGSDPSVNGETDVKTDRQRI